jgi:hypothetical protein
MRKCLLNFDTLYNTVEYLILGRKLIPFIFVVFVLSLPIVHSNAQQVQSITWSSSEYFQGDSGSVTVVLYNNHNSYQICTKQFYIQFDWQPSNTAFASSETPCIASGQSYTFTIYFSIPTTVSVGYHTYNVVWVDSGFLLGTVTVDSGSLYVHDAYEKVYDQLAPSVQSQINSASYRSPTAQADLNQAISYYNQAVSLANQGEFQAAVNDLNQASNYIQQANVAEQTYLQSQSNNNAPSPSGGGSNSGNSGSFNVSASTVEFILLATILVIGLVLGYLVLRKRGTRQVHQIPPTA